jgi:hypothetical protein
MPLISSQSAPKINDFLDLSFMKFANFTVTSISDFNLSGMRFEAGACLWMLQCVRETIGATAFIRITNTPQFPVNDLAPPVQMPMQREQYI